MSERRQVHAEAVANWFEGPWGRFIRVSQNQALEPELKRLFGSHLVHYGPLTTDTLRAPHVKRTLRLGGDGHLGGVEVLCDERCWPLAEQSVDAVVLQHGLDFAAAPHALLREAARVIRPGGRLLVLGFNPYSLWGVRRFAAGQAWRQAHFLTPGRVCDWLSVLGLALEQRQYGGYPPPVREEWRHHLDGLETYAQKLRVPCGAFYLVVARKVAMGMRPLRNQKREKLGQLLPMPVAKVVPRERRDED